MLHPDFIFAPWIVSGHKRAKSIGKIKRLMTILDNGQPMEHDGKMFETIEDLIADLFNDDEAE